MNIISVKKVLIYLFYLIPAFLILGPLLPELVILLINIIFLIKNFSLKKIKIYVDKIFFSFTILFGYIFINSFFQYLSNNLNELLLIKSFALLRFPLFYLSSKWLFQNLDKKEIKVFFYIFISTISFVIFDVIFQYFFGSDIFGFKAFVPGTPTAYRLTGPFGDELIVGSYLSRFGIVYLFSLICLFKLTKNINEILILIFLVAVIFIIGERAAFLLFLFASVLLFFEKKKLKFLGIYTALFITLIVIVLNYDDSIKKRMLNYTIFQLNINLPFIDKSKINQTFGSKQNRGFLDSPYGAHYETAYNIFKDYKIFGAGYKQFRQICGEKKYSIEAKSYLKENRCSTHPHNLYLEILSESGIIGFLIFLGCIYFLFEGISNNSIRNKYLIIQILIFFFPLISTGSFFTNKNLIYLFFIITVSLILNKKNIKIFND
tara:strand:+ start:225 stop:1523 length:1299 start_codon:yes stop_codon:yes gene_type:complete